MKFDIKKDIEFKTKKKPQIFERPERLALCIEGTGNPNDLGFASDVQAMYATAYGIKMPFKKAVSNKEIISDFDDYTVPPLQGYWTISKDAQERGSWTKDDLVYHLEMVIPDFVPLDFIEEKLEKTKENKADISNIKNVYLGKVDSALVCQILHIGPYDEEPKTFLTMDDYINNQGYKRTSKEHREIYLGDVRRAKPENLKTILQVGVEHL